MAHTPSGTDDLRQRSLAATREIATVVREIRELATTPCTDWDERWHHRRTELEARKAAFVAECQDIEAMRSGSQQHNPRPSDAHGPRSPAVAREVQR
jgi:hypothetical protein